MFNSELKPVHKQPTSAKLRQTLLYSYFAFRPDSPKVDLSTSHDHSSSLFLSQEDTLPHLPTEIWLRILPHLHNLALKNFRLVCRRSAALVPPFLYSTVYLNNYEKSWAGLIAISQSRYALLVEKIAWNPLVLYRESVDADCWASLYPNLLQDLRYEEILSFHEAYKQVYRASSDSLRSSSIESISKAVLALRNCRQILISDDHDIEKSCVDSRLRRSFQGEPHLLTLPATWGLSPRMWDPCEIRTTGSFLQDVLKVFKDCDSITYLDIDLWVSHWNAARNMALPPCRSCLFSHWSDPEEIPNYPHINDVSLKLKYCKVPWTKYLDHDLRTALRSTFPCFSRFSCLENLAFELRYTNPRQSFVDFVDNLNDDDESDGSQETCDEPGAPMSNFDDGRLHFDGWSDDLPRQSWLDLIDEHAKSKSMTGAILRCMYSQITPSTELSKLKLITFSNGCLDARFLLRWLCGLPQVPSSQVAVTLAGTVVLFGLDPVLLFRLLASLNVTLSFDQDHTFYYAPENTVDLPPTSLPEGNLYFSDGNDFSIDRFWINEYEWDPVDWGKNPCRMPDAPLLKTSTLSQETKILYRPNDLKALRARYESNRIFTEFTYRVRLSEQSCIWEWVNGKADKEDVLPVRLNANEQTLNLFTLQLWQTF